MSTLNIQTSSYTDNTLVGYSENPLTATTIKAVHFRELRSRVANNVGTTGSGGSGAGLVYVLSDVQGSTRAVMNNNGSSSSVVARHDYLPFGEELGSGIGSRTLTQGYNASDGNRWKYAMTERDATSGLDHTWFRKYESLSGRWTSPDPYGGSATTNDPQSFNRYAYTQNDPVNFLDPSGLDSTNPLTRLKGLSPVVDAPSPFYVPNSYDHGGDASGLVTGFIDSGNAMGIVVDMPGGGQQGGGGPPFPGGTPNQYAQLGPCPDLVVPAFGSINQAAATLLKNTYGSGADAAYGRLSTYEKAVFLNTAAAAASVGVNLSTAKFASFYRSDKPGNLPFGIELTAASGKLEGRHADIGSVELNTKKGVTEIDVDLYKGGFPGFLGKHGDEARFNEKYNRPTHPGDVTRQLSARGVNSGASCKQK